MTDQADNLPALPTIDESKHTPVPLARLIELRKKKLTYEEIGAICGITKQAVSLRLQPVLAKIDVLDQIKGNRADVLTITQDRILDHLTDDKLQKSSAYQLTGMYGILYDKERLERGQSTANVAYADMSQSLREMDAEIRALEAELGECEPDDAPEQGI